MGKTQHQAIGKYYNYVFVIINMKLISWVCVVIGSQLIESVCFSNWLIYLL